MWARKALTLTLGPLVWTIDTLCFGREKAKSLKFKLSTFNSQSAFYAFSFFHSSNGTCCSLTRFFTSLLLQRTFSHMQPFLCFIASILFRCHVWISCLDAQANQLWQADSLICNADGGGTTNKKQMKYDIGSFNAWGQFLSNTTLFYWKSQLFF